MTAAQDKNGRAARYVFSALSKKCMTSFVPSCSVTVVLAMCRSALRYLELTVLPGCDIPYLEGLSFHPNPESIAPSRISTQWQTACWLNHKVEHISVRAVMRWQ